MSYARRTHATIGRGGDARHGYAERVAEAFRLRALCSSCDGPCPPVVGKGRNKMRPGVCECGGRSNCVADIARALGVAQSTAGVYLTDPTRELLEARKRKYRGVCADCDGPTDTPAIPRCQWCKRGQRSPYRIANSPTGFRQEQRSTVCGVPGCDEPKRDGGHVCEPCAPRYRRMALDLQARTRSDSLDHHFAAHAA